MTRIGSRYPSESLSCFHSYSEDLPFRNNPDSDSVWYFCYWLYGEKDKTTAGSDWFDLPKTELTMELGRDLKLLRMRSVLDPKRHYKKENGNSGLPEFSQVATVIEGPTEFFSARITKKERKRTFVGEALVVERETRNFETKYNNIQASKRSGKKSFYRSLRARRSRKAFPLTWKQIGTGYIEDEFIRSRISKVRYATIVLRPPDIWNSALISLVVSVSVEHACHSAFNKSLFPSLVPKIVHDV